MKGSSLLLLAFILFSKLTYSQVPYDSCFLRLSKEQLISEVTRYSDYWISDSLANNGFRRFFGRQFLRCSGNELEGVSWAKIDGYLGKPHFTFKASKKGISSKAEIVHYYVLHTYGDFRDFKEIGNLLLQIIVVNGVIKSVGVSEND